MKSKYQKLFLDITIVKRGKYTILYTPISFLRKWLTLIIPVVIINTVGLQLIILLNINIFSVIIYGQLKAHKTHARRLMEYLNESMVLLITYSMICMTLFNQDELMVY